MIPPLVGRIIGALSRRGYTDYGGSLIADMIPVYAGGFYIKRGRGSRGLGHLGIEIPANLHSFLMAARAS